jgi:5-methylcytosine-specific restriction endonuclease McrA
MSVYGNCCICGIHSKLSFEHVPPRAAYNDQRVFEANIRGLAAGNWGGQERPAQGKWLQRGAGKETLCEQCNNCTGSWYGMA